MNSLQPRFEILLPQRFNDGQPVPDEFFADTLLELRQKFKSVSSETQIIQGMWEHAGQLYRDQLVRIFVDVEDLQENHLFFKDLKELLKKKYCQIDIRITTYLIEVF